jgi:hypothetical protein
MPDRTPVLLGILLLAIGAGVALRAWRPLATSV